MRSPWALLPFSFAIAGALTIGVLALFSDSASVPANAFVTDTLDPPTAPASTGVLTTALSWTATSDTYAAGHRVLRSATNGGPYTQVGQITPRTTTTYAESPAAGTYYYVLRSYLQNWESVNSSQVTALVSAQTGYLSCSANAAVANPNNGDGDGYERDSVDACANGGNDAEDRDSGTAGGTACNSTTRDRHLFYNYGFSIPAGASIRGIEVRLDAWVDSTAAAPQICVEISWDGGTTWTAGKITSTLTTAEVTYTLGSSTDTWGRTFAQSEFTNANFRIRTTTLATVATRAFSLDWIPVQVTYTP